MYNHILLPVEIAGPEDYNRAYEVASVLLADGGKITILTAFEPVPTYVTTYIPPDFEAESRVGVQEKLDALAARLGNSNTAMVFGSAGRSIVDWADANNVDCIVMASHSPVFSDLFLGSTAALVVRHAKTSVHVLR